MWPYYKSIQNMGRFVASTPEIPKLASLREFHTRSLLLASFGGARLRSLTSGKKNFLRMTIGLFPAKSYSLNGKHRMGLILLR